MDGEENVMNRMLPIGAATTPSSGGSQSSDPDTS
jgi:hypothetical protein